MVFARAALQAKASIATDEILNTGCSVDDDAQLADCFYLCPGSRLAAEVKRIGIGASLSQQMRIGSDVTMGAGFALVMRDASTGSVVPGKPVRVVGET